MRQKAREKGEKIGEYKKAVTAAKKMLARGVAPEIIADDLDLDINVIRGIMYNNAVANEQGLQEIEKGLYFTERLKEIELVVERQMECEKNKKIIEKMVKKFVEKIKKERGLEEGVEIKIKKSVEKGFKEGFKEGLVEGILKGIN